MKLKGQLEQAQFENISSDPSNLPEGRFWNNTTSNLSKIVVNSVVKVFAFVSDLIASNIVNTPSGNLASTNVQSALNELQSDVDTINSIDFVTPSNTKTLTNKIYNGGTASATNILKVPANTYANLLALTRQAGNVYFATDQNKYYGDNGTLLVGLGGGNWFSSNQLSLTNSGTISLSAIDAQQAILIQGGSSEVTLSDTPFGISTPEDRTIVQLIGNDDTNSVTIISNDSAKGCIGNFSSITLFKGIVVKFMYLASLDRWVLC